jgi:putative ABC transport system ATP-binding protein
VTKRFPSGESALTVLSGVSLQLHAGATCAIIGPSGSGKTTLLGVAAGLERPTEGRVSLCGREIDGMHEDALALLRRDEVGFVFQSFHLMPTLTALENAILPLEIAGRIPIREAHARGHHLLDLLGMAPRAHHYPSQLSGGEQQRVALARAFVNEPKILFADEPTGNLDGATARRAIDEILSLNDRFGTALLLVTHDLTLAARTQRVISLREGIAISDTPNVPAPQSETPR